MNRERWYINDNELRLLHLAVWTYLDSFEGDYDADSVAFEKLLDRITLKRRQVARRVLPT